MAHYTGAKMTKKQALEMLAQAKAEMEASDLHRLGMRFDWAYIRSNRRDLIDAFVIAHPNHPSVRVLRAWKAKRQKPKP